MLYIFGSAYVMFYIFLFPIWPIVYIGWYVGAEVIEMNFAKWILGAIMFIVGYSIIRKINISKGKYYTYGFIALEYIIADIVTLYYKAEKTELVIYKVAHAIVKWGIANT